MDNLKTIFFVFNAIVLTAELISEKFEYLFYEQIHNIIFMLIFLTLQKLQGLREAI